MSINPSSLEKKSYLGYEKYLKFIGIICFVGVVFIGLLSLLFFNQTSTGSSMIKGLQSLFAMDSVQALWYVTRAAGLTSYFLLWLSMVWGMAIATKILHPAVEGTYSYDFHEFLSLLGLGFVILHVTVLLFDKYLPFSIWQILIPFIDTYRPFWVGLGIIGFYLFLLVAITFYLRKVLSTQVFRSIHTLSLFGYLGATLHGLFAGTDSTFTMSKLLYGSTFLVVLFLTIYWFLIIGINKREKSRAAIRQNILRAKQKLRQN